MSSNPAQLTSSVLRPGDKVGEFVIVQQIGAGGMSTVWKAHDRLLDRFVAIKQIHRESAAGSAEDEAFRERFRAEVAAQKRVASQHKHLVRLFDYVEEPRGLFLIMEYVDGPSLEQLLATQSGPMDLRQALGIIGAATMALSAIHGQQVVHRDLKPANILLPKSGGLKVCDFGLAALMADQDVLGAGTVRYMAPELFGSDPVDGRADLYSLGMIAYEMLVGREKFEEAFKTVLRDQRTQAMRWMKWHTNARVAAPALSTLNPQVPKKLGDLVARMMEKDRDKRVPTADELLAAIRRHFTGQAEGDDSDQAAARAAAMAAAANTEATKALPRRSKLPWILAATAAFWVLVGLGYLVHRGMEWRKLQTEFIAGIEQQYKRAGAIEKEGDWVGARAGYLDLADKSYIPLEAHLDRANPVGANLAAEPRLPLRPRLVRALALLLHRDSREDALAQAVLHKAMDVLLLDEAAKKSVREAIAALGAGDRRVAIDALAALLPTLPPGGEPDPDRVPPPSRDPAGGLADKLGDDPKIPLAPRVDKALALLRSVDPKATPEMEAILAAARKHAPLEPATQKALDLILKDLTVKNVKDAGEGLRRLLRSLPPSDSTGHGKGSEARAWYLTARMAAGVGRSTAALEAYEHARETRFFAENALLREIDAVRERQAVELVFEEVEAMIDQGAFNEAQGRMNDTLGGWARDGKLDEQNRRRLDDLVRKLQLARGDSATREIFQKAKEQWGAGKRKEAIDTLAAAHRANPNPDFARQIREWTGTQTFDSAWTRMVEAEQKQEWQRAKLEADGVLQQIEAADARSPVKARETEAREKLRKYLAWYFYEQALAREAANDQDGYERALSESKATGLVLPEVERRLSRLGEDAKRRAFEAAGDKNLTDLKYQEAINSFNEAQKIRRDRRTDDKIRQCRLEIAVAAARRFLAAGQLDQAKASVRDAKDLNAADDRIPPIERLIARDEQYANYLALGDIAMARAEFGPALRYYDLAEKTRPGMAEVTERKRNQFIKSSEMTVRQSIARHDYREAWAMLQAAKNQAKDPAPKEFEDLEAELRKLGAPDFNR